jgi:hypothetical protein
MEKRYYNYKFASAHGFPKVRERRTLRWSTNFGKWALECATEFLNEF